MVAQEETPLTSSEQKLFWQLFGMNAGDEFQHETVCSIHKVATSETRVPTYGGYLMEIPGYKEAKVRRFPNSFNRVWNGTCFTFDDPKPVVRWVCAKCRSEENAWLQKFMDVIGESES